MEYNTFEKLEERVFDLIHHECSVYLQDTLNTGINLKHHDIHGELLSNVISELYRKRIALETYNLQK
jgi:hypothetical protein